MAIENIIVGTKAIARVGRNAIEVEVIAPADGGAYCVRNKAGKEFTARRLEALPETSGQEKTTLNEVILSDTGSSSSPLDKNCHTCGSFQSAKHLSLMNAAVEVLRRSEHPLNTREIVAQAAALGLWMPTGAKTPEQTLYGAIFREIATKEQPRIVKEEQKGKFRRGQ